MKGNGISVWVFEQKPGTWLFKGNPNTQKDGSFPPCHLGSLLNIALGDSLIAEDTRYALSMHMDAEEWNLRFPQFKVRPVRIIIDWHYRPRKEVSRGK